MKNILFFQTITILIIILLIPIVMVNSENLKNESEGKKAVELHLNAEKYEFTPNKLTVQYGTNVTLVLHAKDRIHGFYLEGYEITQTMCNEHNFTISFIANKVGTYIYKCNEPACGPYHPYMVGSLTVLPNNQFNLQLFFVIIGFIFITAVFIQKRRNLNDI